jgi:flavin-dependent dehydrogenase
MQPDDASPKVTVEDGQGNRREVEARFVLDASGFGRVLSRLLDLEVPSRFPPRMSLFRHVADRISVREYDRDKILISINPINPEIWYWMIPLAGGMTSMGVVGLPADIESHGSCDNARFSALVQESGLMATLLADAEPVRDVGRISGYACSVKQLYGPGYALLGNAGEFLDPIFSSGVTIALKSASLAAKAVDRQLKGQSPDWDQEFSKPLIRGVDTFRAHVAAWYDGSLQRIIFHHPEETGQIKEMLTSVLAGYAWDEANPFVRRPEASLERIAALCG